MLTGKRFGFLFWVWYFSLSLSAVQISSLPKQETSWGSCSTAYRKKPASGLQALAQSTLKPSAWLIRDLLLCGLHLSPLFTSCEEQKTLDLWQSLTIASVRAEPQKASNQRCVARANSDIPSLQASAWYGCLDLQKWDFQSPCRNPYPW